MIATLLFVAFVLMMLVGVPIGAALGLAGAACIALANSDAQWFGLLACITFANVLVRYFTDSSFAWTEEFSVFLMILLAMVAGSAAVARDRHIRIEYFSESGSMARRKRLSQFGAVMVAALFFLIAGLSCRMVFDDIKFEETSPGIGVPQWWYTIWLPVMSVAIAGRALGLFIRRGRRA